MEESERMRGYTSWRTDAAGIALTSLWHIQRFSVGIGPMNLIFAIHHGFERSRPLKYGRHNCMIQNLDYAQDTGDRARRLRQKTNGRRDVSLSGEMYNR